MSGSIKGHCLCGAVTIELTGAKDHIEICQCDMCRRWSGAFYTALEGEGVAITGEDNATVYRSSDWAERGFCSKCGSNLWFRFLPTGNRSFSAGLFDEAARLDVEKEIFVDEAADWSRTQGDHPRLTGEEIIAEAKAAGFTFD
ncbi:GFA family protein [Qipengyuania xiapuensis]|uniref:GFA family protein n=1 Tax=Qipengyuania xiapuensis TaxID=2867236 RepID=A0ABX8ZZ71_9SPHN|nr:GFA family protein [Qipengyuania xiapuensis]QZD93179.1 GFA family protein [Qipengyuania xiapuensis]